MKYVPLIGINIRYRSKTMSQMLHYWTSTYWNTVCGYSHPQFPDLGNGRRRWRVVVCMKAPSLIPRSIQNCWLRRHTELHPAPPLLCLNIVFKRQNLSNVFTRTEKLILPAKWRVGKILISLLMLTFLPFKEHGMKRYERNYVRRSFITGAMLI